MKLIAHRGNIEGPNLSRENSIDYIEEAISEGFDVEIDLRWEDQKFYLGHDECQYHVPMTWMVKNKDLLWIHCKNQEALEKLSNCMIEFNYFWHQEDDFTLTSKNYIWTYPGKSYISKSIVVMPEWNIDTENLIDILNYECFGICSDYVKKLK